MNPRIDQVRNRIQHHQLDALVISSLPNIRYLFGFTGSNAVALISEDSCHFITDRRYEKQCQQEVSGAEIIIAKHALNSEFARFSDYLKQKKVGVEAEHLSLKDYHAFRKVLPKTKLLATERVVESICAIKDPAEIKKIAAAAKICQTVFHQILELVKPGMTELELSAEISYRAMQQGSEKDPFEPIVASGLRSALPHGISSSKKLAVGDLIVIDFGATVSGYAADFTRTIVLGKATQLQTVLANAVKKALEVAEAAARPGITGKDLDKVARDELTAAGYAQFFKHSLGHGLGLNVHEVPRIGEKSADPLMAGNVITLEPGVYLPDVGGVRIEDDFVITQEKARNLTPVSRELFSVG